MERRMSSTIQLFTRLEKHSTSRESHTGKEPRGFPHSITKQSLDSFKENINYETHLRKVKSALKIDCQQITSKCLLELRREYDKMAKSIQAHSTNITIMKKDIKFMRDQLQNQTFSAETTKERAESRKRQLTSIQTDQEYGRMETKVLEHMAQRMKQDQLFQKNGMRLRELDLKEKRKDLKAKEDEALQWDHTIHRIHEQMANIQQQFDKHSEFRELKFKDYEGQLQDLEDQEKFQLERKERTDELLSIEMNDILDAKNTVLREVLLTNKALDKLLERKISELLIHYHDLQTSYHMIKTETVPHPYTDRTYRILKCWPRSSSPTRSPSSKSHRPSATTSRGRTTCFTKTKCSSKFSSRNSPKSWKTTRSASRSPLW
jgi:hypothetical protein